MQFVNLDFEFKADNPEEGTFTGIASVYGVEDLDGDIIDKGAFTKTISENPVVPILLEHDSRDIIGEGTVSEWQGKIMLKGKLDLDDPVAEKAFQKMKKKLRKGLSIGFTTIKSTWQEVEGRMVRHIQELKLWEVSSVLFPALPAAQITRTKQADEEINALKQRISALEAKIATLEPPQRTPEPAPADEPPSVEVSKLLQEIEANL